MSILQKTTQSSSSPSYMNNWFWEDENFHTKTVSTSTDRYTLISPSVIQVDIDGTPITNLTSQTLSLSLDASWDHGTNLDHVTPIADWQANHAYTVGDWVRPSASFLADGLKNNNTLCATPTMVADTIPYGIASTNNSSTNENYKAFRLFDGFIGASYYWYATTGFPYWVKYDFGSFPKVINKLRYNSHITYHVSNWIFQGSNVASPGTASDSADWTTLYPGVNVANPGYDWTPYFSFTNSTAYRHYRMYITSGVHASTACIRELQLVEPQSLVYRCTIAGTSHATTEPVFPATEGSTVTESGSTLQWTAYKDNTNARNRSGNDYFVYACIPTSGTTPKLVVSKQSTYPLNYTALNSRKIGGFHCFCDHMSVPNTWKGGVVATAAVGAGGTGYTVGDVLTITGGNNDAKATVAAVSTGVVTAVTLDVYNTGTGYTAGTLATTGGTGNSDCTITVTIKARVLGETVVPSASAIAGTPALANYWYRCITAGTSHTSTEPTWNQTVDSSPAADGTVTWICENKHSLAGYLAGDILPQSVWDLRWRSGSKDSLGNLNNNGQVYDPSINKWVGIYLPSGTTTAPTHTFGGTILDTVTWNGAVDTGSLLCMRLARDSEFQSFAEGSNQKTTIYRAADPATVTAAIDSSGRRCVSNIGVEGCAGVMQQWLDEQGYQFKNAAAHYHQVTASGAAQASVTSSNYSGVVATATKSNGGSGYTTGDVLTIDTGITLARVTVTASAGVVTSVTLDTNNKGTGYVAGTYSTTNYSGTMAGSNCTVTVTIATEDLAPAWGWSTGVTKYRGQIYGQDATTNFGDVKVTAGGSFYTTDTPALDCGSRARRMDYPRWTTSTNISFRLVAKHITKEFV